MQKLKICEQDRDSESNAEFLAKLSPQLVVLRLAFGAVAMPLLLNGFDKQCFARMQQVTASVC
jgi:hypothetical protein